MRGEARERFAVGGRAGRARATARAGPRPRSPSAPGSARRLRKCSSPIIPAPTMPYRTVRASLTALVAYGHGRTSWTRARRELGRSGLSVGPLAFGCWRFTHEHVRDARTALDTALECGMHLVDTADVYGLDWGGAGFGACEALLGRVLADAPELRDQIVLATKGGIHPPVPYDSSADHLRRACEASLHRLEVDTIDLYQVHRPDLFAHPEVVATTLLALRDEGKIRAIGISNHTPSQHDTLHAFLGDALATTQPEYSAVQLDAAPRRHVRPLPARRVRPRSPGARSPAAASSPATDVRPELLAVLDELAGREGVTRAAVAIAFTLAHPSRPVSIVGTQQPGPPARLHRRAAGAPGPDRLLPDRRRVGRPAAAVSDGSLGATTPAEYAWFGALCDDDYEYLGVARSGAAIVVGALRRHRARRRPARLRQRAAAVGLRPRHRQRGVRRRHRAAISRRSDSSSRSAAARSGRRSSPGSSPRSTACSTAG